MAIVSNKLTTSAILHAVANTTWVIAGNNSVSNVATGSEVLTGATIKQVWFGSPSGNAAYWILKRGANTVGVFDSTAWIDFAGNGGGLTLDPAANVVVELHNATTGYIMIEIKKQGANSQYLA